MSGDSKTAYVVLLNAALWVLAVIEQAAAAAYRRVDEWLFQDDKRRERALSEEEP